MSEETKGLTFRTLKANEIELRAATVKANGYSLLLYKDARCDMNILDETVGALGWKRSHSRENANCTVEIWDQDKEQWIGKEDTGKASYTEKEKGLASDSFKRSCFNWGIGRELYSSPFIWIPAKDDVTKKGEKYSIKFSVGVKVDVIEYDENREISKLRIIGKDGKARFMFGYSKNEETDNIPIGETMLDSIIKMLDGDIDLTTKLCDKYKVNGLIECNVIQGNEIYKYLKISK
jgi:hypothetical protein